MLSVESRGLSNEPCDFKLLFLIKLKPPEPRNFASVDLAYTFLSSTTLSFSGI